MTGALVRNCSAWLLLAVLCGTAQAIDATDADWPDDDIADNPYQVGADELRFMHAADDTGWLHSAHRLTLSEQSLNNGWVDMQQCHNHLDAIDAVDIVYRYREIRALEITESSGIGHALAREDHISLSEVEQGARLCARARVRILNKTGPGEYLLRNGPFHRRFLDGYFPMRVTLEIHYPANLLDLIHAEPQNQPGFSLSREQGLIKVDTRFSGPLELAFRFRTVAAKPPQ